MKRFKKGVSLLLCIISLVYLTGINVYGLDEINREFLDEKLQQVKEEYTIKNQDTIEEEIKEQIENEIADEEIIPEVKCEELSCKVKLKSQDLETTEIEVRGVLEEKIPSVSYQTHVEKIGWQEKKENGILAGTTGQAKRLEAIILQLNNVANGSIEYMSHIQSIGWETNWKRANQISGTTGQKKRLEAIRIRLTGEIANQYDIYYRVHVQTYGWLSWAKNGELAGTTGLAKRLEAIEVKLVPKNTGEQTRNSYVLGVSNGYQIHMQKIGWKNKVMNGTSGEINKGLRLEAFKMDLTDPKYTGSVEYMSHIQSIGWENKWTKGGNISGTTGRNLRLEAIKIRLTGELANIYDIYYRTYCQNLGWLGWAKNGEIAGSMDYAFRLEAIEVKLLPKDTGEATGNSYKEKDCHLTYQAHVQSVGNQNIVNEGAIAGTTGKALRMEAIKVMLQSSISGNVIYQSKTIGKNWETTWRKNGEQSGTTGISKALEFIKINLEGEIASQYDIYYRVHCEKYGWLGWAKNGEIAGVSHYDIQAIEIRLYLKIDSNKNGLNTKNHYIEKVSYTPVYYAQKDARWTNYVFGLKTMGATGCTPTSLAMAFSGILGKTILPIDVAKWLYNNTSDFNKNGRVGAGGNAVAKAAEHYGVKRTALTTKEAIKKALQDGKIVYAAMGNGRFATLKYNHAIVIFNYSSANGGQGYAYDPLKSSNNGWITVDQLWNERSKDPDDATAGGYFHSLERY